MEYASVRLGPRQRFRPQEELCPRPANSLVSLQYRAGTIRSPGEGFVDGPYIFRPVWGNHIDYSGVLRSPDEDLTDNAVTFKSRDEGFGVRDGIFHNGQELVDNQGGRAAGHAASNTVFPCSRYSSTLLGLSTPKLI